MRLYGTYWWDHKLLSPTLDWTQMAKLNITSFEPTIEPKKNWAKNLFKFYQAILSDRIPDTYLVQSSIQDENKTCKQPLKNRAPFFKLT